MLQRTVVMLSVFVLVGMMATNGMSMLCQHQGRPSLIPCCSSTTSSNSGTGRLNLNSLMEEPGLYEEPPLQVTIKGGLGIKASVKNLGTWDAVEVDWLSTLLGGYFVAESQRYRSGTIPVIAPGQEVVVMKTSHLFGLGYMNVIVNVGKATGFQHGYLLGVVYIPLPSLR